MGTIRRVRLVFKDDDVLSVTQKSEGLNRSWVLLNINQRKTISEVISHLFHAFQIQHSCPNGLLLSIDGFMLPPFESTYIPKDKDIIRVKKRGHTFAIEGNNIATIDDKSKTLEKQPENSGVLLLANEEYEKEKEGYESDEPEEDDGVPVKDLEGVSGGNDVTKKIKRRTAEECQDSKRRLDLTRMESERKRSLSKIENKSDFKDTENVENNEEMMRSEKPMENGQEIEGRSLALEEPKKISRNTRRTYASRKLKKEMVKIQKKNEACVLEGPQNIKKDRGKAKLNEVDCLSKGQRSWRKVRAKTERNEVDGQPKGLLHWKQLSGSNTSKTSEKCQQQTQTIDLHKDPHQNEEVHEEPIQNGEVHELGDEAEVVPIVVRPGHIRFEPLEKEHAVEQNQVPVVGKVSWVNTESRQIMLMPVPDYPVVSKTLDEDEYVTQPDNSLYNEDGSLEIDLSFLVDVRFVKGGNTGQRNESPSCDNEGPVGNDHVT